MGALNHRINGDCGFFSVTTWTQLTQLTQFSSIFINFHQFSSIFINFHQFSSIFINFHQFSISQGDKKGLKIILKGHISRMT